MIDPASVQMIHREIIRDGRSLLQYVGEAFPYAPSHAEEFRARLGVLAGEEQDAVARLIGFLQRRHVRPPMLGAFPSNFTTSNYVALAHLVPALIRDQQLGIAELERAMLTLPDGEARTLLRAHLEMKRQHLRALQELGGDDGKAEAQHPSVIPSDRAKPAH